MLDLYCERLGPGLWAEPLNALSNVAFFVAAWASWRIARRLGPPAGSLALLIGLMAAIGVGSMLFHTFATSGANILDVGPILLFQACFLWFYLRRETATGLVLSALAVGVFLVVTLAARQFSGLLNGSLAYLPAFTVLLGLGAYHYNGRKEERSALLVAAGVFAVALAARTIDQAACPYIPFGTHFLWHVLTAAVAYLAFKGLVSNWRTQP